MADTAGAASPTASLSPPSASGGTEGGRLSEGTPRSHGLQARTRLPAFLRSAAMLIATLGAVGAFLILVWLQIHRPLLYDDVSFAFAGQAVARTGLPFANAGYMGDRYDYSQREQWALWHPPLYIYVLGLTYKLLGLGDWAGRSLGIACTLATAGLLAFLGRRLADPAVGWPVGLLAAALYLLNPLTLQSAIILDIDGTVLTVLVVGLVALYVHHVQAPGRWDLPIMSLVFALALWAKMTTPLGLLFAIVAYRTLAGRPLVGLREAAIIGLPGAVLFLATWALVTRIFGMPWDLPFATLWVEFVDASGSTREWRESPEKFVGAVAPSAYWISPALLVLFGAALIRRVRDFLIWRRADLLDVVMVMGLGIYAVYLIKLAGLFPKYHIAAVPFLSLAAAWVIVRAVPLVKLRELVIYAVGLLAFTVYYWRFVSVHWADELFGPLGPLLFNFPVGLLLGLVGVAYLIASGTVGRHVAPMLAVMSLGWGLGMGYLQARAPFSTNYWYGAHGQVEAAALLDTMVAPDEFWGGGKEVAYYASNQNFIDQDAIHYWIETYGGFERQDLSGHRPRVLAVWTGHSYIHHLFHEVLADEYRPVAEVGTYTLLVRRGLPPASRSP